MKLLFIFILTIFTFRSNAQSPLFLNDKDYFVFEGMGKSIMEADHMALQHIGEMFEVKITAKQISTKSSLNGVISESYESDVNTSTQLQMRGFKRYVDEQLLLEKGVYKVYRYLHIPTFVKEQEDIFNYYLKNYYHHNMKIVKLKEVMDNPLMLKVNPQFDTIRNTIKQLALKESKTSKGWEQTYMGADDVYHFKTNTWIDAHTYWDIWNEFENKYCEKKYDIPRDILDKECKEIWYRENMRYDGYVLVRSNNEEIPNEYKYNIYYQSYNTTTKEFYSHDRMREISKKMEKLIKMYMDNKVDLNTDHGRQPWDETKYYLDSIVVEKYTITRPNDNYMRIDFPEKEYKKACDAWDYVLFLMEEALQYLRPKSFALYSTKHKLYTQKSMFIYLNTIMNTMYNHNYDVNIETDFPRKPYQVALEDITGYRYQ